MIWMLIAAIGTGICLYQVACMILAGGKAHKTELRLEEIAAMGSRDQEKVQRWEGSLLNRMGRAAFVRLTSSVGSVLPISAREKEQIRRLTARCGLTLQPEEYMVMQILAVAGGGLAGVYLGTALGKGPTLGGVFGLYGGYTLFRFVIKSKASKRQNAILDQLPELLDLLSISVGAGLGFNQAFQYISEQCEGPLAEEFVFAGNAMALGRSRRAALEEMASHCDIDELRTFVSAVIQADEMGISLRNILVTQAQEARHAKRMRTEEKAQKIPIKMLLPLGLLIFPVMLIILMAPAIPRLTAALL